MNLSKLVAFRESLNHLSYIRESDDLRSRLQVVIDTCNLSPGGLKQNQGKLESIYANIDKDLVDWHMQINQIKNQIDQEIKDLSQSYFLKSYQSWDAIKDQPIEQILKRELRVSDSDQSLLEHRISTYSNWKYPGVLLRPAETKFLSCIMDLDPMYLVDVNHKLLEPCLAQVTPLYAQRLRKVVMQERQSPHWPDLPTNQIGFFFAWNFFNYTPIEVMKELFQEIWNILRPGGVCLFTYNNCRRSIPVVLAEHSFASYTPDWAVRNVVTTLGFEVIHQYDGDYHLNWMEIRKPGNLSSLRGGQTLGRIVQK